MKNKILSVISYLVISALAIAIGSYLIGFLVEQRIKKEEHTQTKSQIKLIDSLVQLQIENKNKSYDKISEYPDYKSLQNLDSIDIAINFESYTEKSKVKKEHRKYLIINIKGKITKGYLDVYASTNNFPLTKWESIYFKVLTPNRPKYNKYGGHLFRPESLKVPPCDITHILFSLDDIPFIPEIPYSENSIPKHFNLFNKINNNSEIRIITYISALTKAKINSIKLFYKSDLQHNNGKCEFTITEL